MVKQRSGAGGGGAARKAGAGGSARGGSLNSGRGKSGSSGRMSSKTSAQTGKSSKVVKVAVGVVVGAAVAGGAGVAVYDQVIEPSLNDSSYILSEYEVDENGESRYKVTSYRLSKAKKALESLKVRRSGVANSAYNSNGLVPEGWKDTNGSGCDTRYDVLMGTLSNIELGGKCKVAAGEMFDFYTGKVVSYADGIDIDHIVAKKDAWESGGYRWSGVEWEAYANDAERVVMATSDSANRSKQDKDAAEWLPENRRFWCVYVVKQIEIKDYYGLSVRAEEKERMGEVLGECEVR